MDGQTTLHYTFMVNIEKDAEGRHLGFDGYRPGHALQIAYTGTLQIPQPRPADAFALNKLFEVFNIAHPADYRGRSMSVGDVVLLRYPDDEKPRSYACASIGWEQIAAPEPANVRVAIITRN